MIAFHLGSIPFGSTALSGPTGRGIERQNTWAEYPVTRGKPVLHEIGEELDTQDFQFFFSEEFCDPLTELAKLELAFALKTPLPLSLGTGGYDGKRYVVDALSETIQKTNKRGAVVRVEASISLLESPVQSLFGLITSIAKSRAPAISITASINPNIRR